MSPDLSVREVAAADVLDLRWRVLRSERPRAAAMLDGDDDPATVVLAAYLDGGADRGGGPVSTATVMDQPCPWRAGVPARRLRAMATDEAVRGLGAGSAVLAEAVSRTRAAGAVLLWCHARAVATTFYRRAGFIVDGEVFDVPGIGPHFHMHLELD